MFVYPSSRDPLHVVIAPVPAAGHVNPTLGLVAELVRWGHRVSYLTTEAFADRVRAAGAVHVPLPQALTHDPGAWPRDMSRLPLFFLEEARAVLPRLEEALADRPDIVLSEDPAGGIRVLARSWGVPSLQIWQFFATRRHWTVQADLGSYGGFPHRDEYLASLGEILTEHGVEASVEEYLDAEVDGGVVFLPRAFQYEGGSFGQRYAFVGPCPDPGRTDEAWEPADDRPVLLVSLGSMDNAHADFFRRCVTAFADAPWRVVLAIGGRVRREELGPLPEHVEAHAWVPQVAVLRRASAFVNHGGMGSVMEGLAAGVPMVCVPRLPEQVANARRVEELGLGRRLDPADVMAERLRSEVDRVATDTRTAERMRWMREEIRGSGGAAEAADAVERAVRGAFPYGRGR
ncbi:macrolide family glycosyltransferase [Nocardiopsis kunsanensis]|uniref:macrolide family glycosyltransferase n=1 Tax=Nocardiopsis kunsanensis TaxID=141693 RepID=UPI0003753F77|nr:macrolide family glycosyltransferase [Nocardiopsis kunsanensis]